MPVIPYGTGTALEGGVVALHGGICIDMSEMNNIIKLNHGDMDVVVQPGVTRRQLAAHLKDTGLFFPIDPGADASLGGMASTRASGTNAVRYGTMKENVINLEAVMADGSIIRTGGRSKKSAAGYDLTRLMVGSEGTLGVITELTVKLYPVPEAMSSATCTFDNLEDAVNSVIQIIQCGIPVARVELIDAKTIEAINVYSKMDYSVAPTLFFEFHGSESYVQEQAELAQEITADNNGGAFTWTRNTEESNKMWRARHDVAYASKLLHPKGKIWSTDVCVPISNLAECLLETQQDIDQTGILAPMVGHVGDGNFHLLLLVDHDNPAEVQKATDLHERMVKRALSLDGTCTGEHGIGFGKIDFLKKEHGPAIQPMLAIKKALDPKGIMNPGKIFEWASPA
jgi:D-lactate dehydrogenase (cytochrome)